MTMFTNIYCDNWSGKVHLREVHNGKHIKVDEDVVYRYYLQDDTGRSDIIDAYGNKVKPMIAKNNRTMQSQVEEFKMAGKMCGESDMPSDVKFLQDRYCGVELKPDISNVNICYMDIEIASERGFPHPKYALYPINLITCKSSRTQEIHTFGANEYTGEWLGKEGYTYHWIPDETDMLTQFVTWFRRQHFDVVSGWNCRDFDIHYIVNRCRRLGIKKSLSPFNKEIEKQEQFSGGFRNEQTVSGNSKYFQLPGISILDFMLLYKNFTFETRERYTLQFIAEYELKKGKLELDGAINEIWKYNWNQFVDYNIIDTILPEELEAKLRFIDLSISLCHQALVPFEKVTSSIAIWDGYIMRYLREMGRVMPDRPKSEDWFVRDGHHVLKNGTMINLKDGKREVELGYVKGGHVFATPGMNGWTLVRDYASLYPHDIMMFNISPETKILFPSEEEIEEGNLIKSPLPHVYYKDIDEECGLMPTITRKVYNERVELQALMRKAREDGDKELEAFYKSQQHIRKILLNSLYGASCNNWFHFFDLDNARVITRVGRTIIRHVSQMANDYFTGDWNDDRFEFYPNSNTEVVIDKPLVTLIDTDSNHLCVEQIYEQCGHGDPLEFCLEFNKNVLDPFFNVCLDIYASEHNAKQIMNFELEKVLSKELIQGKKQYIMRIAWDDGKTLKEHKLKPVGLAIKKSDTPPICRAAMSHVVNMLFDDYSKEDVCDYIREQKKEFKSKTAVEIGINKSVNNYSKYTVSTDEYIQNGIYYQKSTPIHVRASINHNYLVKTMDLPYFEIDDGTKIQYIYIKERNMLSQNVIGFVGNYPPKFEEIFVLDYDMQFQKTFVNVVQRFFDAIGWGKINLKRSKIEMFME